MSIWKNKSENKQSVSSSLHCVSTADENCLAVLVSKLSKYYAIVGVYPMKIPRENLSQILVRVS